MAEGSAPTGRAELFSPSAVEQCRCIVDGSATSIPVMYVSEALAILVYRLVIDGKTRAEELSQCSWGDAYAILASLSLGQRVTSDSAAGQKLNKLITRKGSPSRLPGLDGALRMRVCGRGKDNNRKLKDMTYDEAERHLLLKRVELPLVFDFGGGAADGGAGASPAALDTPDQEELPLADLGDEVEVLLALIAAASDEGESAPPADDNMEDAAAAALTTPAVLAC